MYSHVHTNNNGYQHFSEQADLKQDNSISLFFESCKHASIERETTSHTS